MGAERWCVAVVVCFTLALSGCESGAALGAGCTRTSECSAPLVCRLGRCRTECVAARDCGPGQVCLLNAAHEGACEIPAIDTCMVSCDAPLICAFGHCRVECTADTDCPEGHGCARGACERSDSTPDSGPDDGGTSDAAPRDGGMSEAGRPDAGYACDPVRNVGCTAGRCGLSNGVPVCTDAGPRTLGELCTAEEECGATLTCQGLAERRCVQLCDVDVDDEASCGPGLVCSRDSVAHQSRIDSASQYALCTERCDLLTNTGCPSDGSCDIGVRGGAVSRPFTWCRELRGVTSPPGGACADPLDCDPGLTCRSSICVQFCESTADCGGRACDTFGLPGQLNTGHCALP